MTFLHTSPIITHVISRHLFVYSYFISLWPFGVIILSGYRKYVSVLWVDSLPLLIFFSKYIVMIDLLLIRHVIV